MNPVIRTAIGSAPLWVLLGMWASLDVIQAVLVGAAAGFFVVFDRYAEQRWPPR